MRKNRSTSLSTATMIGGSTSYFSTPPVVDAGGIALVQSASGTTADGSAGLTVPFGAAVVSGAGMAVNGTFPYLEQTTFGPQFGGGLVYLEYNGTRWVVIYDGDPSYQATTTGDLLPFGLTYEVIPASPGIVPAPTVACSSPVTAGNSVFSFPSAALDEVSSPMLIGGGGGGFTYGTTYLWAGDANLLGWYAQHNLTGGETGVSLDTPSDVRLNNIIAEFSGLANADAEDTATNSATSTTLAIGTITPTSANNLLTAIFAFNADVTVVTPPAGWTLVDARQGGASVWQYVYARVQSTATPQNPTIVLSGSADIAGAAAAFGGI